MFSIILSVKTINVKNGNTAIKMDFKLFFISILMFNWYNLWLQLTKY